MPASAGFRRAEPFFDREDELRDLERAWSHPSQGGQMALVYGRRRLGKTYQMGDAFLRSANGISVGQQERTFLWT